MSAKGLIIKNVKIFKAQCTLCEGPAIYFEENC